MSELDVQNMLEVIGLTGFVLAQVIALVGVPDWLPKSAVSMINLLAGNYRKAKNIK